MRIIDNHNLDEWLFDYFEGNLGAEEKKELTGFLHKNPALKADYDAWKMSYVREPEIVYPGMNSLLRTRSNGYKWIKAGIAIILLVSLFLLYLFYPSNENKQEPTPDKKNNIPAVNEIDCTDVRNTEEQEINEKSFSIPHKKQIVPLDTVVEQNKKVIITPEEMHPVIPGSVYLQYPSPQDSLSLLPMQIGKIKIPDDSTSVEKNKRSKKEMKIIKLKNTGL